MSTMERTTRGAPCIFCGDVGYDMRVYHNENGVEEVVHYCHKNNPPVSKGDIITAGSEQYVCIAAGKELPVVGAFNLWKRYLSKEEWMAKQELKNPDWKKGRRGSSSNRPNSSPREISFSSSHDPNALMPGEVPTRPAKEQHVFNTFLASLLVLEDKHKEGFRKEWESTSHPGMTDFVLKTYPIRSMPPVDQARYSSNSNERFRNLTRKKIIEKLMERFGDDLSGYPMMYLRSGGYWDNRPMVERWTFSCGEGVLFPCIDKDGYLWRYRIKNEYPDVKIEEGKHLSFDGKYGRFTHYYDNKGNHCWGFKEEGCTEYVPVYGPGSSNTLKLNAKGMPEMGGKPQGKYANISSSKAKRLPDGNVINQFNKGCRSGSPYSLYYQKGDSFKVVIGTEGEKKSMVANRIRKCPVVSVPGVTSYSVVFEPGDDGKSLIDVLKEKGMKYFILCYDADKEDNDKVLKAEQLFLKALKEHGVTPLIGEWKGKFNKGIDDILLMGLDISVKTC